MPVIIGIDLTDEYILKLGPGRGGGNGLKRGENRAVLAGGVLET